MHYAITLIVEDSPSERKDIFCSCLAPRRCDIHADHRRQLTTFSTAERLRAVQYPILHTK